MTEGRSRYKNVKDGARQVVYLVAENPDHRGVAVTTLEINSQTISVDSPPDTPLLWVLRDYLGMTGTKFGCGATLCRACTGPAAAIGALWEPALAHEQGAETFALVSAIGASVHSHFFYAKTKGDVEGDVQCVGFKSLTLLRPSMIDGKRDEFRFAESVALRLSHILGPILPRRFRANPASKIAEVLVNAVVASEPGCHFRYSDSLAE